MDDERTSFLPDFCHIRSVFAVVLMAELLAFILVLARPGLDFVALGMLSLFIQWIALSSAALLCVLRPWLARPGAATAGVLGWVLVVGMTALVSTLGQWLLTPGPGGATDFAFIARATVIGAIAAAVVLRYLYIQHQWAGRVKASADARVEALQARIRPHFLFNSLNTIVSLIRDAPATAEQLVEDLADLFRASLSGRRRFVTLAEELAHGEGYLRMEAVRLGSRLSVERDLDGLPMDAAIPPLMLQPLLENAVYYGIEPREEGGAIRLAGRREGDVVVIELTNPLPVASAARAGGFGMAQANVSERLALAFGESGRFQVNRRDGVYHVTVRFPYRQGTDG